MPKPKFTKLDIANLRPKSQRASSGLPRPPVFTQSQQKRKVRRKKADWKALLKQPAGLVAASLVMVLGLQSLGYLAAARSASGEILGVATSAYSDLNAARSNIEQEDFSGALALFRSASNNIVLAQQRLNEFQVLKKIVPQAQSADNLLSGAASLSDAGQKLSAALNLFSELKVTSAGFETANLPDKIRQSRDLLAQSRQLLLMAGSHFDKVRSVPADYTDTLTKAKMEVNQLEAVLAKLIGLQDLYLEFFGGQKNYLMVFQNYDEQRATGGFIGTYGSLQVLDGRIERMKIESIYQIDGQIHDRVAAPGPFQPEIKKWGMRDANWFADFPASARKLLEFYEKGSSSADGVIALSPKLFEQLLLLTGPIEMPVYEVTLTAENFQDTVQYKTSVDYDKELNQPKKFLDDFAPMLLDRLSGFEQGQWLAVMQILQDSFASRHVLLYSTSALAQNLIEDLGFSGQVLETGFDYLSIIGSNLGGTKTDLEINQEADLVSKVHSDGSIMNTLTIKRSNGAPEPNRNYLRVLVPLGSQLVSSEGFDEYPHHKSQAEGFRPDPDLAAWDEGKQHGQVYVRSESGKTEFAGWVTTGAASERRVTLTYSLPFKFKIGSFNPTQEYSLLVQKQAASKPLQLSVRWEFNPLSSLWTSAGIKPVAGALHMNSTSSTDNFWAGVFQR